MPADQVLGVPGVELAGLDDGLLAGELFLAGGIGPVGEQLRGRWRDANVPAGTPQGDAAADIVDELVFFDAVLSPFRFEGALLRAFFSRPGNRDEIGTGPAALLDFVGDSFVGEAEMLVGSSKGVLMIGFAICTLGMNEQPCLDGDWTTRVCLSDGLGSRALTLRSSRDFPPEVDERLEGGLGQAVAAVEAAGGHFVGLVVLPAVPGDGLDLLLGQQQGKKPLQEDVLPGGGDAAGAEIGQRAGGVAGERIGGGAAGGGDEDDERHADLGPAVELPADF